MDSTMFGEPEQATQVGQRRRAKYEGVCARTGVPFAVGEEIVYDHVSWGEPRQTRLSNRFLKTQFIFRKSILSE